MSKTSRYIKRLLDWNEKRLFDKLTPGQKTAYMRKLLGYDETKKL